MAHTAHQKCKFPGSIPDSPNQDLWRKDLGIYSFTSSPGHSIYLFIYLFIYFIFLFINVYIFERGQAGERQRVSKTEDSKRDLQWQQRAWCGAWTHDPWDQSQMSHMPYQLSQPGTPEGSLGNVNRVTLLLFFKSIKAFPLCRVQLLAVTSRPSLVSGSCLSFHFTSKSFSLPLVVPLTWTGYRTCRAQWKVKMQSTCSKVIKNFKM